MKTLFLPKFALLTMLAALPAGTVFSQAPSPRPSATPSVSVPAGAKSEGDEEDGARLAKRAGLTMDEKLKLRAAHKAAMQDPAVKAAEATRETDKKSYRKAVRAAMLKSDPSVGPILDKMREARPRKKEL